MLPKSKKQLTRTLQNELQYYSLVLIKWQSFLCCRLAAASSELIIDFSGVFFFSFRFSLVLWFCQKIWKMILLAIKSKQTSYVAEQPFVRQHDIFLFFVFVALHTFRKQYFDFLQTLTKKAQVQKNIAT